MLEHILLATIFSVATISPAGDFVRIDSTPIQTMSVNDGFRTIIKTEKIKAIDFKDGYVYYTFEMLRSDFTENSTLNIIHIRSEFVPGYAANRNGGKSYDKGRYLSRGYVHVGLRQFENLEKNEFGRKISVKETWPRSTTYTSTISSSFGSNIAFSGGSSAELTIGNGGSISVEKSSSIGLGFTFNKSVSTVTADPTLSAQTSPNDVDKFQWNYNIVNYKIAGTTTYYLDTYSMFEMDKHTGNKDAVIADVSISYTNKYEVLWFTAEGSTENHSLSFHCVLN